MSCIDPDAYTAATYNGDVIDMQDFRRVIFILQAGDLGSSATLDYRVEGSAVVQNPDFIRHGWDGGHAVDAGWHGQQ